MHHYIHNPSFCMISFSLQKIFWNNFVLSNWCGGLIWGKEKLKALKMSKLFGNSIIKLNNIGVTILVYGNHTDSAFGGFEVRATEEKMCNLGIVLDDGASVFDVYTNKYSYIVIEVKVHRDMAARLKF